MEEASVRKMQDCSGANAVDPTRWHVLMKYVPCKKTTRALPDQTERRSVAWSVNYWLNISTPGLSFFLHPLPDFPSLWDWVRVR